MTSSAERQEASGEGQAGRFLAGVPLAARLLPLVCFCAALVCVLWGLHEFDGPVAQYFRTITLPFGGGTLTVPWMAFVSNAGNWLGDGRQLLTLSAMFLAVGWAYAPSRGIQTGVETLWAHGIATVLVHTVKHLLGRPRPKFSVSGEWSIAPSLTSGFDSFPSGHTTATFAVAAVLARRFPHYSLLFFGAGAFVALSRVVRGSHFTTDVFGGIVLGVISGVLAMAPWKDWRNSVESGLRQATIGTVWIFALLWVLTHRADPGWESAMMMGAGAVVVAISLWGRIQTWRTSAPSAWPQSVQVWLVAMGLGLSLMTTAPLVMAAAGLLCVGLWAYGDQRERIVPTTRSLRIVRECELWAAVLLTLAVFVAGRGLFLL